MISSQLVEDSGAQMLRSLPPVDRNANMHPFGVGLELEIEGSGLASFQLFGGSMTRAGGWKHRGGRDSSSPKDGQPRRSGVSGEQQLCLFLKSAAALIRSGFQS